MESCRICFVTEPINRLFRPCNCPQPVHRDCLHKWRCSNVNPLSTNQCEICTYVYKYNDSHLSTNCWPMITIGFLANNYALLAALNIFLIFSLDIFYTNGNLPNTLKAINTNNIVVYYLISTIIITMVLAIIYVIHFFYFLDSRSRTLYLNTHCYLIDRLNQNYRDNLRVVLTLSFKLLVVVFLAGIDPIFGIFAYSIYMQQTLVKYYKLLLTLKHIDPNCVLDITEVPITEDV